MPLSRNTVGLNSSQGLRAIKPFLTFCEANLSMRSSLYHETAFATSALMLSMPRLFSLSCDMVERTVFLMNFKVLKPRSSVATVGGMAKKIRAATKMLEKMFLKFESIIPCISICGVARLGSQLEFAWNPCFKSATSFTMSSDMSFG